MPEPEVVYAVSTGVATYEGQRVVMTRGEAWFASDPFVKARPELFVPDPPVVRGRAVETASKAPGERKTTKRPAARKS